MAAQDLIISRRGPATASTYLDSDPAAADASGPDGAAVLFATLRKRWLLLVVIALVSGGLASLAAWQFGKNTATVKSAIIYTGLADSNVNNGFDPLGAATGAEMLTSVKVLKQLCDRRGLEIPPSRMADFIATSVGRSSSLINVSLSWNDVDDGIAMLNELTGIFIEEMAVQRKAILRNHLQHIELLLLQAKGRVDDARTQLDQLRTQQRQQLDKGGLTTDQYRSTLSNVATVKTKIDDKRTEQLGIKEQIDRVTSSINAYVKKQHELEDGVKKDLLHEAQGVLTKARDGYAASSAGSRKVNETIAAISRLIQASGPQLEFDQWQKKLTDILQNTSNGLQENDRKKLDEAFTHIPKEHEAEFVALDSQRRRLEEQRDQMQLNLIPIKNQIVMLEQQRVAYEKQAEALGEQITGISTTQIDESQHQLDETGKQQDAITVQRDALRQLTETRLREWTVTVPASMATAQVDSNRAKLFIVIFGLCWFALSAPLFVSEWHHQSGSPQVQLARSLRVPVLAERILEHFSPQQRGKTAAAVLGTDQTEIVRMLTLRIQQSCHRPGSVVLFSSLDSKFSAAPLMAAVAECLAEREERVLLVDAVCPQRALLPVLNLLSAEQPVPAPQNGSRRKAAQEPVAIPDRQPSTALGLSEYLSEECEAVGELIQPTGCPGVDLIASGRRTFPREAMASSCLTELLNTCRKNYTMVLVHGPAVDRAADLQMLTARADGIVLAATKASGKDPHARDFVQDLLDLGAPLIGLVA